MILDTSLWTKESIGEEKTVYLAYKSAAALEENKEYYSKLEWFYL